MPQRYVVKPGSYGTWQDADIPLKEGELTGDELDAWLGSPCLICCPINKLPNELKEFMLEVRETPAIVRWFANGNECFNCKGTGYVEVA
jgi:hypothetical protein